MVNPETLRATGRDCPIPSPTVHWISESDIEVIGQFAPLICTEAEVALLPKLVPIITAVPPRVFTLEIELMEGAVSKIKKSAYNQIWWFHHLT